PGHEPTGEAAQECAGDLRDALVPPERRDLAEHAVLVRVPRAGQVLREPPRLPQRVLARRRVVLPGCRGVRNTGAVAERPNVVDSFHLQRRLDLDPPALVERQAEALVHRVRTYAGRPNYGARQDAVTVGENCRVRLDRLERRADSDVDAATCELP